MVIDVLDMNLKELGFNVVLDNARHKRGIGLFNQRRVTISEVEKKDDDEYYVEAYVDGNYDTYETTLKISKNVIYESSCTCEDYRKGNLCKHIIATAMETLNPHSASTEVGREKQHQEWLEALKKHRQDLERRREEERKQREYREKYHYGLETIDLFKPQRYEMNNLDKISIPELYLQSQMRKKDNNQELATSVKIEPKLEYYNSESLRLSFKIGQSKMYVLKDLAQLYQNYKDETEIRYGKLLKFVPKKENFEEGSRELFDYIINYEEILEYRDKYSRYSSYNTSDKEIYITGNKIEEIIEMLHQPKIADYFSEYEFTNEKLNIRCVLKKEEIERKTSFWEDEDVIKSNEYVLRLNISDYKVLFSNKMIYIFYENKIYTLERERELVELLKLFENRDYILIPEDKLDEFNKYVVQKSKYVDTELLPEEVTKDAIIVEKLASKILLDVDDKGNILLELKFCYGDVEFNVLEDGYKKIVSDNNIVRDIPAEANVITRIFNDGFELPTRKEFVLKNQDSIYEFLSNKIEGYMSDFEVLVTDKFKNKQIRQPKISNVGIRIDNGLLELDISKINIDVHEIKNILKDYKIKKKYHRLKNGDFLQLADNEDIKLLEEMETTLDIDYSKVNNGVINLPVNRSLYLEKLFNSKKEISVSKNEDFTKLIDNMQNNDISESLKIDKELGKHLRDYQKNGYKWLKTLETYKFGGILADDMGLGKTIQIIALLKSELKNKKKSTSIVVCPSTLVLNWKLEIEKWCGELKTLVIRGNAEERKKLVETYKDYDLLITSYDLLKRDVENYDGIFFKYIIADEAQYIKNSSTQNATSLKSLKGENKFALTGTPIENSVAELWSLFDFVMPGYLYNYNKFKKKFEEPIIKYEDTDMLVKLKKLISPFILRRVKSDVLTELPEKNIIVMKNEMESEQEKLYLSYLAQTKKEVSEELNNNSFEKSKLKILMLLTRLRQICCHPGLFIENYNGGSGKLNQCMDLIVDATDSGHKILLFSSYTSMFEIIEKELEKLKIKYFKLVGDTPVNKRIELVDEFNKNKDIKVFLISLKAGGTGLNLTSADVVIHYDPWWNISSENQATDRAYRIGQKNSVQVYKLITTNSIEEKINKMQERKEKLSKDILSTKETFINKLSKEEILDLFE